MAADSGIFFCGGVNTIKVDDGWRSAGVSADFPPNGEAGSAASGHGQ